MRKSFFETFEAEDKTLHKSIKIGANEWALIEAYRLYGASKRKCEISVQKLIRKILLDHINADRDFVKEQGAWVKKLEELKDAAIVN